MASSQTFFQPGGERADAGRRWHTLADTSRHWQTLADTGRHWQTLAEFGRVLLEKRRGHPRMRALGRNSGGVRGRGAMTPVRKEKPLVSWVRWNQNKLASYAPTGHAIIIAKEGAVCLGEGRTSAIFSTSTAERTGQEHTGNGATSHHAPSSDSTIKSAHRVWRPARSASPTELPNCRAQTATRCLRMKGFSWLGLQPA
ncbi:hypothetical protein K432DRAFT_390022 [Lepidopterella palustris CBS 459.81]|uniref:Uncharacterized protein n=1 Tax=Lepidopterella palustris CBS 459.81 TaxID=1314670 RepID=A0A8E2EHE0_9PEZI|nr:hypothetical protein K432DRAFT_390022 [Lepidopterella palustris CBS 459.81]